MCVRPRIRLVLTALVLVAAGVAVPAAAVPRALQSPAPGFSSPNVQWLLTIPEPGAVSAHFVGGKGAPRYLYLSTVRGFAIYDVNDPSRPVPLGRLALPNFENEDIDGNLDVALISTSPGGHVFVIDTRNKLAPTLADIVTVSDGDAHTTNCIADCAQWAYATEGQYLKLLDLRAGPSVAAEIPYGPVGPVHDVEQDAEGVVWMSGDTGVAGFAVAPLRIGSDELRARTATASPRRPVKITDMVVNGYNVGRDARVNRNILHSAHRPVGAHYRQRRGASRIARGGVLFVTEEMRLDKDNIGEGFGRCRNAGRFHAFDATGALRSGEPLRLLDTFTLREGTLSPTDGDKQVGAAFCGAHWFTVHDNVVAIGMYGAGTRFLDVSDPRDIRQIGFYFTAEQQTWASYWVPGSDGVVYSVDLERGIDVLQFSRPPNGTTYRAPAPVGRRLSFLQPRSDTAFGWACPIVVPERRPLPY